MPTPEPCITLMDNGSLRPEATFSLRRLSRALAERVGREVHPVSLLHSNKISQEKLDGVPARTLEEFALARRAHGVDEFLVLPLFFGPSAAIEEYLPQRVHAMREEHHWRDLRVKVAPCLVDLRAGNDFRMAQILAELVWAKREELAEDASPSVALVDHGTPRFAVTQVRNLLAEQMGELLGDDFEQVRPCSMERRHGSDFDYNEPLLERLLGQPGYQRSVIVSMLFLQPGRHAGPGGDVAGICQAAEQTHPGLRTHMTKLVGSHPALVDLLAERLGAAMEAPG